ncbi:GGDEF domain-containing protein [Roseateles violae]|uniref:diguanylate cyclase n=1 Tax=Roseateles violae TaxID=3058042 RepID=A0ABT8DSB8_9BURK|nr:GGDEF domain-containing protein [Pelomonas sp. PFR6]MDN3921222.1 GGDEF domain-containing protein [Pelomonas sp. PFR6]
MHLDVPTLFILVTVVALLMALLVCVMAWGKPASAALWPWALALVAYALSNVLFGLRAYLPWGFSMVGANSSYALALALMLTAVRRFQSAQAQRWQQWGPVLLAPLVFALLYDHYLIRVVVAALLFTTQIAFILAALLDSEHPITGRGRMIVFCAFALLALTLLVRALAIWRGWLDVSSPVESNRWQAMLFIAAMGSVLSMALGFVYMTMEKAERQNFELAMKDMLTGLSNRRAISDVLQAEVARAQRQGQLLAVLMLDIDHFKKINDGYGHQAGDVVLRGVAQTLRSRLRAQDQIGRFGGEEFLLVLPDTGLEGALIVGEALRQAVEATPTQWGAQRIPTTISIGVRGGLVTGAETADTLVAAADAALYRAKHTGRNRCEH